MKGASALFCFLLCVSLKENRAATTGHLSSESDSDKLQDYPELFSTARTRLTEILLTKKKARGDDRERRHGFRHSVLPDSNNACRLKDDLLEKMTGKNSTDWIIDSYAWEQLEGDLQLLIECTKPNDKIIIKTSATLKPARRVAINHDLLIEVDVKSKSMNVELSGSTPTFTCPDSGPLFLIWHGNVSFSGVHVNGCSNSTRSAAIIVKARATVQFVNIVVKNNNVRAILIGSNARVSIEYSVFRNNTAWNSNGVAVFVSSRRTVAIYHSSFVENQASGYQSSGGAIYCDENTQVIIKNSTFSGNQAAGSGGGIFFRSDTAANISGSTFEGNEARTDRSDGGGGGAIFSVELATVTLTDSKFIENKAKSCGGAVYTGRGTRADLSRSSFAGNRAENGGAFFVKESSLVTLKENCKLLNNSATNGGSLYAANSNVEAFNSVFLENNAALHGGGIYLESTKLTILSVRLSLNQALGDGGGIYASSESGINGSETRIIANSAKVSGGGIALVSESVLLCRVHCELESNTALSGGGLYIESRPKHKVAVKLVSSTFKNNTVFSHGGGILHRFFGANIVDCNNIESPCNRVALVNTSFVDNLAGYSGAIVFSTDPYGIWVHCQPQQNDIYWGLEYLQWDLFRPVSPTTVCSSWTGNRVVHGNSSRLIGTYGRDLHLSVNTGEKDRLTYNETSGYVLHNVTSGEPLPNMTISSSDSFGNDHAITFYSPEIVKLSSAEGLFNGNISVHIRNGSAIIRNVVSYSTPGKYKVLVHPHSDSATLLTNLTVVVRECLVNEEPTQNRVLCQDCGPRAYNFNTTKPGGCTTCPKKAVCPHRFIIPKKGYWHKSPCHFKIQECLIGSACDYENRRETLIEFTTNQTDCNITPSFLELYGHALCKKGYEGPLCNSCAQSYGKTAGLRCLKCPTNAAAVFSILSAIVYLSIAAYLTITGSLPHDMSTKDMNSLRCLSSDAAKDQQEDSTPTDPETEIQRRAILSAAAVQENEIEVRTWKTTEVLKILLNFVQQTAIAATINVGWSEAIMDLFEASDFVGALSAAAASRPIDCLLSGNSKEVRSIWRKCISVLIPIAVILLYATIWGVIANRTKKDSAFYWRRTFLSVLAVTYISYLGLTKIAIKVFYCIDVDISDDQYDDSESKTSLWAIDSAIECFSVDHMRLVALGLTVLVAVTICFPLSLGLMLYKRNGQHRETDSFSSETMGFLYRAFKRRYAYWECVVMIRKACLSVIVVFSYSFGGQIQGTFASIVFLLFLYIHFCCLPYDEKFKELNYYESFSLLISSTTLLLAQLFESDKPETFTKDILAVCVLGINSLFFVYLAFVHLQSMISQWRAILEYETVYVTEDTPWWQVVKLYITAMYTSLVEFGSDLSNRIAFPGRDADE